MTLRDYFAGQAISGNITKYGNTYKEFAQDCYKIADAMLKERDKNDL